MRFLILFLLMIFCAPAAEAEFKYDAPKPTAEFEKMPYAPVYLTFSWEAAANTEFYQVQVINSRGQIVRDLRNGESLSRVTDWQPLIEFGNYYWQVRVIDGAGNALSDWSEPHYFYVEAAKVAALGDSITHGGADFIPAGQLSCQWETFCNFPVKNIGRSGDTTAMMIARFDSDVLPFKPKMLLILGGINDIREGKTADEIIANLKILREKCAANGIEAVFCTLTPINEFFIRRKKIYLTEKDWRGERLKVNRWILENGGVEIARGLYDEHGELRSDFTPDGLHPNVLGKVLIGKAIEKFLEAKDYVRIDG